MESKKKKIIIGSIIGIVIVLVIVFTFFLLKSGKKESKKEVETKPKLNIVSKTSFPKDDFVTIKGENVYVQENGKIVVKSLKGEEKEKTDFTDIQYDDSAFIIYKNGKENILKNVEGKTLATTLKEITTFYDEVTKKSYYQLESNLYDDEGNQILAKINQVSSINDGFVYFETDDKTAEILVLDTKETLVFSYRDYEILDRLYEFKDIFLVCQNKKYYIYRKSTKTLEKEAYTKIEKIGTGFAVSNDLKTLYFDFLEGEVSSKEKLLKVELSNNYYLDYTEDCVRLKNKEGKAINNLCYYDAISSTVEDWYLIPSITFPISTIIFPNGKLLEVEEQGQFLGDYLYMENATYNQDGEKMDSDCLTEPYVNGEFYTCGDGAYDYFLDDQLHFKSENYDSIDCYENGFCVLDKDAKKGLWYQGNVVIEPSYLEIKIVDNFIVAYDFDGFQLFQLGSGETISSEELKINTNYSTIDIESIIKEYELENIRTSIEENKEFFQKYAYIVHNNNKIGDYKKMVFNLFKILVDNKEHLNENYFLSKLRKLNFSVESMWDPNEAGSYDDSNVRIKLLEEMKTNEDVIYHELFHFIDFSIHQEEKSYFWKNKFISKEDYLKLSREDKNKVLQEFISFFEPSFIIEGGAEFYSGIHFKNDRYSAYATSVETIILLSAIYGYDKMEDIFFSTNGYEELYNLIVSSGKTKEDYDKMIDIMGRATYTFREGVSYQEEEIIEVLDNIVDMYIYNKGKNWMNDNEFCYIISSVLQSVSTSEYPNSKYKKEYQKIRLKYNEAFHQNLYTTLVSNNYGLLRYYYSRNGEKTYIIIENRFSEEDGVLKLEYDFEKDKIIRHDYIKMW